MRLRALLGELQPLQQPRLVREGLFESYLMREAFRCTQVQSEAISDSFARDSSSRT